MRAGVTLPMSLLVEHRARGTETATPAACCGGSGVIPEQPQAIEIHAALKGALAVVSGRRWSPGAPFDGPQTARERPRCMHSTDLQRAPLTTAEL